ncbi:MAG TPA: head GIN domain-containing protein [Chryseosolibacter sp.]|nr:head GIN domain-containing protein [Chryseosolibacter sp.]
MKKYVLLSFLIIFITSCTFAQQRETRNVGTFTKIGFRVAGKLYIKQGSPQKVEIEGDKDAIAKIETKVEDNRLVIEKEEKWNDWSSDNEKITVYVTVASLEGVNVSGSGDAIGQSKFSATDFKMNVSGSGSLTIEIDAKGEIDADVSGSGEITLKGNCDSYKSSVSGSGGVDLNLTVAKKAKFGVSGSGEITASGSADETEIKISGSGKVLAAEMTTNISEVQISGSGDAEVNVKNEIDASITGSGTVSYKGDPKKVNSNASGSGKLRKL